MSTIVAAVDASAAASAVLAAACRLAEFSNTTVTAIHVVPAGDAEPSETVTLLAARFDVPLQVLVGPVEQAIRDRIEAPDVAAAVVGARRAPGGRRPVGHIALDIAQHANRPVLVVPPELAVQRAGPWRRVLVPLEGTAASTGGAIDALGVLSAIDVEAVVLHVFTTDSAPLMLDRPSRDLALWDDEFLARFGPPGARIEHRSGVAAHEIAGLCDAGHADLVVLSWSQTMSPDRAAVVREVLGRSTIPVLLLAAGNRPGGCGVPIAPNVEDPHAIK